MAGISVEYLVRIEQGRDRHPSAAVVNALAGGTCVGARPQASRVIRPSAQRLLDGFEPGIAVIANRLGDLLAYTRGFQAIAGLAGLLDAERPNLTRFVFTDPRAAAVFPDWEKVADEQAFSLSCSPADHDSTVLRAELTAHAGESFSRRLAQHQLPARDLLWLSLPTIGDTRWERENLEFPPADGQQLTVLLPADSATEQAVAKLLRTAVVLHAVN